MRCVDFQTVRRIVPFQHLMVLNLTKLRLSLSCCECTLRCSSLQLQNLIGAVRGFPWWTGSQIEDFCKRASAESEDRHLSSGSRRNPFFLKELRLSGLADSPLLENPQGERFLKKLAQGRTIESLENRLTSSKLQGKIFSHSSNKGRSLRLLSSGRP